MSLSKSVRGAKVWLGVAALGLIGAGCSSQQAGTTQVMNPVGGAQALAGGTDINVGQGAYSMPELPASATETGYALTGEENTDQWLQPSGRWISGTNGEIYLPPAP